jgi:adenine phosphoribosyltransferase
MRDLELRRYVRDIPDFPRPGIVFKDITPLLLDPEASAAALEDLVEAARARAPEVVVGIEARGLIFGAGIAHALGIGFAPVRKPGKLPSEVVSVSYELEYGTDSLELHADAVAEGTAVLIHDDLIATGGTAAATIEAVESLGGRVVGCSFLIELAFLRGRGRLGPHPVDALISYDA